MRSLALVPYARINVRTDVPETMRDYLLERQAASPASTSTERYLRRYPEGELAAQLVRDRRRDQPGRARARSASAASSRGRSSARGASSAPTTATCAASTAPTRITVDALGRPKGVAAATRRAGRQLRLSLDLDLQRPARRR